MIQEYFPIDGWPGYSVKVDGSVWLLRGEVWVAVPKEINRGYEYVVLRRIGGKLRIGVNRIVALVFHGPPPTASHQAAHENGIRHDNRPENITWKTPKENSQDKIRHGTCQRMIGETHGHSKLTDAQRIEIVALRGRGVPAKEIAKKFGVQRSCVYRIAYGIRGGAVTGIKHAPRAQEAAPEG